MSNDPAAVLDRAEQVFNDLINQRGEQITPGPYSSHRMEYHPYPWWRHAKVVKDRTLRVASTVSVLIPIATMLLWYYGYVSDGPLAWVGGACSAALWFVLMGVATFFWNMFTARDVRTFYIHHEMGDKYWVTRYRAGSTDRITLAVLADMYPDRTLPQLMAPFDAEAKKAREKALADAKATDKAEVRRLNLAYQALEYDRLKLKAAAETVARMEAYNEV
jgi:hypothetical protein